jgi:hypothetical protein
MRRDELDRLLARYHTGELSAMERKRLLDAALEDQDVFNELMLEDGLREALADPPFREMALEELNEVDDAPELRVASIGHKAVRMAEPASVIRGGRGWRRWGWTAMATAAAASVVVGVFLWQGMRLNRAVEVASVKPAGEIPYDRAESPRLDVTPAPRVQPGRAMQFETPPAAGTASKAVVAAPEVQVAAELPKAKADSAGAFADRTSAAAPAAVVAEAKDERQLAGPAVILSVMDASGVWNPLDGPVARGVRLKATVTSVRDAVAVLEPAVGRPVALRAGVPAEIELPTSEAGDRVFTVTLRDGLMGRMDEGRTVAMRAMEADSSKREEGARSKERDNEALTQKSALPAKRAAKNAAPLVIRYSVK